ncbi:DNA-3-methyladenine glycosylase [Clostridiaceae bacterium 35-E11]
MMKKLQRTFYEEDTLKVASNLLGKILVHRYKGIEVKGKIVEVEAYIGAIDKAAHSYNNRKTERTKVMFGPPGYAYIYLIYGMYHCMNVVTGKEGEGAAVLIRAVEPVEGIEQMAMQRYGKKLETLKKKERIHLTNGPGKLCKAFGITKENYGDDLLGNRLFICAPVFEESFEIERSRRINIDYAEEAKEFKWRFFIKNNPYVSK